MPYLGRVENAPVKAARLGARHRAGEKIWEVCAVRGHRVQIKYYCPHSGETVRRWISQKEFSEW